jgi:hypothetical protein
MVVDSSLQLDARGVIGNSLDLKTGQGIVTWSPMVVNVEVTA